MSYLMIENDQECPIEGFTKLGVSSHRDNSDCIGQFGSGIKMAILTLLRHNLKPVCYVGTGKIEYETERKLMGATRYTDVYAKLSGKFGNTTINRRQELGFSLEYGAQDWTKIDYAIREFISNAFDQSGVKGTKLSIVDDTRAKNGTTRIFIPITDEVERYIDNIDHFFLQFKGNHAEKIIPKQGKGMRIYRKGVFVTEHDYPSLFDYNFSNEIDIDESRNLKNFNFTSIGKLLTESESAMDVLIDAIIEDKECYEVKFLDYWNLDAKKLANHFMKKYPDFYVCSDEVQKQFADKKGYKTLLVPRNWESILNYGGVKKVSQVMHTLENQGCVIIDPTQEMLDKVESVWNKIQKVGMTNNKEMPIVMGFTKPVEESQLLAGFVDSSNIVYLNKDIVNKKTILEELAHYITGAGDGTKDFEDFIIRFASNFL